MKLLSLNLWNINEPLEERMRNLSAFIEGEKPDIICFQEVSLFNGLPQVDSILKELQYQYVYKKSGEWKQREEGLVIATKYSIEEQQSSILFKNTKIENMQRLLLSITVSGEKNPKRIGVFNTHLSFKPESRDTRKRQMEEIINIIGERLMDLDVCILMGDFNYFENEKHIDSYLFKGKKVLYSTWESNVEITFDSNNKYVSEKLWPDRLLDFIYLSSPATSFSKKCMCQSDGYDLCSDHYGVFWEGVL